MRRARTGRTPLIPAQLGAQGAFVIASLGSFGDHTASGHAPRLGSVASVITFLALPALVLTIQISGELPSGLRRKLTNAPSEEKPPKTESAREPSVRRRIRFVTRSTNATLEWRPRGCGSVSASRFPLGDQLIPRLGTGTTATRCFAVPSIFATHTDVDD